MPRRRQPHATYYVFVSVLTKSGAVAVEMIYSDSSRYRAERAFAQACISRRDSYAVEIHQGLDLLVRVRIEARPT